MLADGGQQQAADAMPVWRQRLEEVFRVFSMVAEENYIYLCDLEHDYSIWSRNAVDMFGLPDTHMEKAGLIWEKRIHEADRPAYHRSIEEIFNGKMNSHDMQYRAKAVNGSYHMCTCRGLILNDENGNPKYFGGSIKNHTLENRVDTLTGLMNRNGFFEAMKGLIRNHQEAVILMFGLSDFSEVNTLYGYEGGNDVLHQIARHFADELSNLGDYFRLDGTQTILISHEVSADVLKEKYERLRRWLFEEFTYEDHHIPLRLNGAMMHLNQFDIDDNTVFVMMNAAFQNSKREKMGDLVDINDTIKNESRDMLRKINAIRLSESTGFDGFRLFYQPIMDATTEKLEGAEALIRWSNEEFGYVSPAVFMPVLENDTHYYALGLWILRKAMTDGLAFVKSYPDFLLHVNIAYPQIQHASFVQDVENLLEETGFPARNFCLELTERCRFADKNMLRQTVAHLKAKGVKFALDDFGTGYSSMEALRTLDIDVVKVDRSIIINVDTDEKVRKVLKNIVELSEIYGAHTCVEGIETSEMRQAVFDTAVDCIQGYYYSKPIPVGEFRSKYGIKEIAGRRTC